MLRSHLKEIFLNLLSFYKKKIVPASRGVYAVEQGQYIGEFFVYIEGSKTDYNFLSLPKMIKRTVDKDSFERGIKNKIIKLVENLPENVYSVCKAQYNAPLKHSRKLTKHNK